MFFIRYTLDELWQLVPLSGCRIHADISVGSGADAVMNDFYGTDLGIIEGSIV